LASSLARASDQPLQALRDNLQRLRAVSHDQAQWEAYLNQVEADVEQLDHITRSVLSFTQPEAEERRETQLNDLIRQALVQAASLIEKYRIQVTSDLAALPPIFTAPQQVTQVFFYLIENAIEAAGERGQVHIATQVDGAFATAQFVDDGPAISPEDMPHIFEPFFTTKQYGTGLGLAISHTIIQQQGGTLRAENVTNERGAMLVVRLPLATAAE
jgi:signal transduction histidine kinase